MFGQVILAFKRLNVSKIAENALKETVRRLECSDSIKEYDAGDVQEL